MPPAARRGPRDSVRRRTSTRIEPAASTVAAVTARSSGTSRRFVEPLPAGRIDVERVGGAFEQPQRMKRVADTVELDMEPARQLRWPPPLGTRFVVRQRRRVDDGHTIIFVMLEALQQAPAQAWLHVLSTWYGRSMRPIVERAERLQRLAAFDAAARSRQLHGGGRGVGVDATGRHPSDPSARTLARTGAVRAHGEPQPPHRGGPPGRRSGRRRVHLDGADPRIGDRTRVDVRAGQPARIRPAGDGAGTRRTAHRPRLGHPAVAVRPGHRPRRRQRRRDDSHRHRATGRASRPCDCSTKS